MMSSTLPLNVRVLCPNKYLKDLTIYRKFQQEGLNKTEATIGSVFCGVDGGLVAEECDLFLFYFILF